MDARDIILKELVKIEKRHHPKMLLRVSTGEITMVENYGDADKESMRILLEMLEYVTRREKQMELENPLRSIRARAIP